MVVADIIRQQGLYHIEGFLDDVNPQRRHTVFEGAEILGGKEQIQNLKLKGIRNIIVGFGNGNARLKLAKQLKSEGFLLVSVIHPSAIIASNVVIGEGTVITAGVVINSGSQIGENAIINTSSSVDHGCIVDDGVHICPGVHLAGNVRIGRGTWIGIGSCVIDHIKIGNDSFIGAGSVVTKDIPEHVVAYGNPARVIRENT